tara:strand:+ start:484 stop:693 length:210 start_codon:yes stop_codon:yes gene_type:complete
VDLREGSKEWQDIFNKVKNLLKRNKGDNFITKTLLKDWSSSNANDLIFVAKLSIKSEEAVDRQSAKYKY